jgi:hypothetical protein
MPAVLARGPGGDLVTIAASLVASLIPEQREGSTEDLHLPSFEYHLDESDPDVAILRRQDGAFVATKEDYREPV